MRKAIMTSNGNKDSPNGGRDFVMWLMENIWIQACWSVGSRRALCVFVICIDRNAFHFRALVHRYKLTSIQTTFVDPCRCYEQACTHTHSKLHVTSIQRHTHTHSVATCNIYTSIYTCVCVGCVCKSTAVFLFFCSNRCLVYCTRLF